MYLDPSLKSLRFAGRLLVLSAIPLLLLACAQQAAVAAPAEPPSPPAAAAADTPAKPGGGRAGEVLAPSDGEWLLDDQGRQYFAKELPRTEGAYQWLDEEKTRVRLWPGVTYEVLGQDEDSFLVKIYRVEPVEAPAGKEEPTAQEKEKVAATYRNQTGAADRLAFRPFGEGLPSRGQWRNGFEIADMNGDGHPDIVHGPARKGEVRPNIFLGNGQGSWKRWDARFPPLAYDYGDVAVADFNGDGRLDLALAMHLRGLKVLVADGPASFKEWSEGIEFQVAGQGSAAAGFTSRAVEAADWNGDGRPDLIALGEGPRMAAAPGKGARAAANTSFGVTVYLNQGDGTWSRKNELQEGVRLFGDDLAVADFTRDGVLDIVLGSSVLGEQEILRVGGGGGSWSRADLAALRPRSYVGAVDAADFNGDGHLDLAVGYLSHELGQWRTGIDLLLGGEEGGWERKGVAVEETRDWLTALGSGDLDGDGKLDLAAATGDGEVWIFLGKGDGTFLREESPEIPPSEGGCRGYDIRIADLDGEAGGELVVEFAGEPSALFAPTQCLHQGSLTAWKAARKQDAR